MLRCLILKCPSHLKVSFPSVQQDLTEKLNILLLHQFIRVHTRTLMQPEVHQVDGISHRLRLAKKNPLHTHDKHNTHEQCILLHINTPCFTVTSLVYVLFY